MHSSSLKMDGILTNNLLIYAMVIFMICAEKLSIIFYACISIIIVFNLFK